MSTPIQLIILAAGKGTRMKSLRPKVLTPLCGKPVIAYLLASVQHSHLNLSPVIVVGYRADEVIKACGNQYQYVYQTEQLGTGHAVMQCENLLGQQNNDIMVLYGDHPLIDVNTINSLSKTHQETKATLTMATIQAPGFEDVNEIFYYYGRIIRNQSGEISKIVEKKDASEEELRVREVNPSFFCFKGKWLWENLHSLQNNNTQNEFYLTDLVGIACDQKQKIATVNVSIEAGLGVNTIEQLKIVEEIINHNH